MHELYMMGGCRNTCNNSEEEMEREKVQSVTQKIKISNPSQGEHSKGRSTKCPFKDNFFNCSCITSLETMVQQCL